MPICTEIMSPHLVEEFDRRVDVIQVGARNMQNFDLLTELERRASPSCSSAACARRSTSG